MALFTWIEAWYNPRRRHSALDSDSPIDFEARLLTCMDFPGERHEPIWSIVTEQSNSTVGAAGAARVAAARSAAGGDTDTLNTSIPPSYRKLGTGWNCSSRGWQETTGVRRRRIVRRCQTNSCSPTNILAMVPVLHRLATLSPSQSDACMDSHAPLRHHPLDQGYE